VFFFLTRFFYILLNLISITMITIMLRTIEIDYTMLQSM